MNQYYNDSAVVYNQQHEDLDAKITELITRDGSECVCMKCGERAKTRQHIVSHVEGLHITGMVHPCQNCGKQLREGFIKIKTHCLLAD